MTAERDRFGSQRLDKSSDLFREEALQYHTNPFRDEGRVLKLTPRWARWTYWLVLIAVTAGALYAVFGTVNEYAGGPAIVKADGRTDLTAMWAGTVSSVETKFGARVSAGDVLVRFDAAEEVAARERLKREIELHLVQFLRNPSDQSARQSLAALRAELGLAEARLEQRVVRAARAGLVSDIRIRPGQHLTPGEVILSMVADDTAFSIVVMLPGHYRPLLRPGLPIRLELAGYRHHYQNLIVESIGDEIVGPDEVRRYLGQEIADTVFVPGPVILVRTRIPGGSFTSDGTSLNYYDGMQGWAEARLRSRSILLALVPEFEAVLNYAKR